MSSPASSPSISATVFPRFLQILDKTQVIWRQSCGFSGEHVLPPWFFRYLSRYLSTEDRPLWPGRKHFKRRIHATCKCRLPYGRAESVKMERLEHCFVLVLGIPENFLAMIIIIVALLRGSMVATVKDGF